MKKIIALMLAAMAFVAPADDMEQLSLVIGESLELAVPFPMKEYRCDAANVKIRRTSNKSCSVLGVSAGTAVIELIGDAGAKSFSVSVVDALQPIIKAIGRDLEEVPEVELSVNNGKICMHGEISKTEHWDLYHLVLSRYQQYCFDYVVFTPGKELLGKFGKVLEQSGYRIVTEATSDNPGCIDMKLAGGALTMTGYFFNQRDVDEVTKIVKRQTWLALEGNQAQSSGKAGSVPCIANFYVVDRLIEVGVVFVTLNKSALDNFGLNSETAGQLGNFQLVTDLAKVFANNGESSDRTSVTISHKGGINGVLTFLSSNGIISQRKAGHVTFNSNGEKAQTAVFQDGGTLNMKVSGMSSGDVKQIEYGFKIEVEGILTHADEVKMNLKLEDSGRPESKNGDYLQEKITASMPVVACLGETIAIGGAHMISRVKDEPSGYAFLRWIPIVSWFTSYAQDSMSDDYSLILVSPEYADEFDPLRRRPSEETEKIERGVSRDLPKAFKTLEKSSDPWYTSFFFWRWFEEEK